MKKSKFEKFLIVISWPICVIYYKYNNIKWWIGSLYLKLKRKKKKISKGYKGHTIMMEFRRFNGKLRPLGWRWYHTLFPEKWHKKLGIEHIPWKYTTIVETILMDETIEAFREHLIDEIERTRND